MVSRYEKNLKRVELSKTKKEKKAEAKAKKEEKIENRDQAISFFDEISDMNKKRRELDEEEKNKLKKALLGDLDEN